MKIAVLSESAADETATRVLVDGFLGVPTEVVAPYPRLRSRGWPSVATVVPSVIRHLYFHTDADALILVVDTNHSPVHTINGEHVQRGATVQDCRLCRLRAIVGQVQGQLPTVVGRQPVKTALGVAIPAIEAWFRVGVDGAVTEAAWMVGLEAGVDPYTKAQLKQAVYGTDRPSFLLETRRAAEEAQRLAQAGLGSVEAAFPNGFGALISDLGGW